MKEKEKFRKRNQRMMKANEKTPEKSGNPTTEKCNTPRSNAHADIRELGLTPRKVSKKIKTKLVMVNAMLEEVKESKKSNKAQTSKRVVANIVSGKILKKYRCLETMSRATGISRASLKRATAKTIKTKPRKRHANERENVKQRVIAFMERDDVSINMPGKKDCKKTEDGDKGEKKQTRVLTDYLSNLHEKFQSENSNLKISKYVFCRLRPDHILLTKLISRNVCLCIKHQNIAMKLKCLRSLGIEISPNPETVSRKVCSDEMTSILTKGLKGCENIDFEEWRRIEVEGKKKMKIVKVNMTKVEFESYMNSQYQEFLQHVERVKHQYAAIRQLKEQLPKNEVVVHMDFAENFTCSNADEIQSAYWNSTGVTLHPVVVYYKNGEDIQHTNFIYVSEVTNHNSVAVYTILKKLVPNLKSLFPDLKLIHYWTDSPS